MDSFESHLGLNCHTVRLLSCFAGPFIVGDFLVALSSFQESSTLVVIIRLYLCMRIYTVIYGFYVFRLNVTMTNVRISFDGD
jgi:hypothetical protein